MTWRTARERDVERRRDEPPRKENCSGPHRDGSGRNHGTPETGRRISADGDGDENPRRRGFTVLRSVGREVESALLAPGGGTGGRPRAPYFSVWGGSGGASGLSG